MSLKNSILKNSLAGISGKISLLIIRVVQVPLFISTLGVTEYGHWIVLSSLPSWLAISNLGFGNVAANEMSMEVAVGKIKEASKIFSVALMLIFLITLIGTLIVAIVLQLVPLNALIGSTFGDIKELKLAIIFLSLSVFISFLGEIYGGRFRAANKAHQSTVISSLRPWVELLGFAIVLQFSKKFSNLALVSLITTIIYALTKAVLSRIVIPDLKFSFIRIDVAEFKNLFKKGMAFQAFPLGNALQFQGNILVISYILGPASVVLFSTARTLVRSINQVMEMINQVIWPQFSLLLGAKNYKDAIRLHRISVFISISSALLCIMPLSFFGVPIYKLWTGKSVPLNQILLFLFLLPIPFNALWFTSSVVHVASNQHEGLAIRYLGACLIALLASLILSKFFGIYGCAFSTIFSDIALIYYVVNKSIILTNDNWGDFRRGVIKDSLSFVKNQYVFYSIKL